MEQLYNRDAIESDRLAQFIIDLDSFSRESFTIRWLSCATDRNI